MYMHVIPTISTPSNPWGYQHLSGSDFLAELCDELLTLNPHIFYGNPGGQSCQQAAGGQKCQQTAGGQKCQQTSGVKCAKHPSRTVHPAGVKAESSTNNPIVPEVKNDGFELKIDIEGFKPEELNVKLVGNCLTIQGGHETKDEQGEVISSKSFLRKCTLPKNIDLDQITCNLNASKGNILISAPKKVEPLQSQEKVIPISFQNNSGTEADKSAEEPIKNISETVGSSKDGGSDGSAPLAA